MQKKIKNKIEAILFDLDGTFIDSSKDMCNALNLVLEENGLIPVNHEEIKFHISKGAEGIIQFACKNSVDQITKNQLKEKFLAVYKENVCIHTHLIDGMKELIKEIEEKKIVWGIVTNKHERFAKNILKKLGYLNKLACLVTGDMVEKSKPEPDSLLMASGKLNKEPNIIAYVGDDRRDIQAGKQAGMITVAADFGFVFNNSIISSWNPDYIITKPDQLLDKIF